MSEAIKVKMLVVDDDPTVRNVCSHMLERWGYEVVAVNGASQALTRARFQAFDLVLTDFKMPEMAGTVLIDHLKKIQPEIVPVIMTGYPTAEVAIDSVRRGAYEFIPKPFAAEELQSAIRRVLVRREEEMRRIQRQFASNLLSLEKEQGEEFDLHSSIEAILTPAEDQPLFQPEENGRGAVKSQEESGAFIVVLCEPIPHNLNILKASDNYLHFRVIHAAHKALNAQFVRAQVPAAVKLVVAHRAAELPGQFRRYGGRICSVIFGPNFTVMDPAMVRLVANSGTERQVVVCHNPQRMHFSWEHLRDLGQDLGVRSCRSVADERETSSFWLQFFAHEIKPFIERRLESGKGEAPLQTRPLLTGEVNALLVRDPKAVELLPGFPPVCQQVIAAIDEGKSYGELAEIVRFDGALQASILRTANLTRFGALQHIETLPLALSMIGVEEIRKLIMGRVMDELVNRINQIGFEAGDYFLHCAATAYLAQLISLNLENPSKKEQEILQGLRVPACVRDCLQSWRLWTKFPMSAAFDSFTGGILHDLGKVVSAVCYRGTLPLVLHEIERARWRQNSLLECEVAVLGDFQHPAMASALLERWGILPSYVDPVRTHHQVQADSLPETVLLALANCLVKGIFPFPRTIDIPKEYRKAHLEPVVEKEGLANPLPRLYQYLVDQFERNREKVGLAREILKVDEIASPVVQELIQVARGTVAQDGRAYVSVLVQQNPEFLALEEWLKIPGEDLLALSLILRETLTERVQQLWESIAAKKK